MLPQNQVVGEVTSVAFSGLQHLIAVNLPGEHCAVRGVCSTQGIQSLKRPWLKRQ